MKESEVAEEIAVDEKKYSQEDMDRLTNMAATTAATHAIQGYKQRMDLADDEEAKLEDDVKATEHPET